MTSRRQKNYRYERACGWNALLPARRSAPCETLPARCDVLVIGAGYTGIAAARRWADLSPSDEILLIDAAAIGEGNAGRNSGFLLEIALAHDADASNLERMRVCNRLLQATMQRLVDDVRSNAIDCQLAHAGTYRAAAGGVGVAALRRYREFLDGAGLRSEWLDRGALQQRIGTDFYRCGLYSPDCYLVQPAALIRGLADALPTSVELAECVTATALARNGGGWRVSTSHGDVRADRVVVANNASCKDLGIANARIVAMYTYAGLTEPLDDARLAACGSDRAWGLLPAHRLGSTLRRTADGRLLIRSLYGYEREADNADVAVRLRAALARRYPALHDVPLAAVWGGATGFTFNAAPVWGELRPGLYVSTGCNGGGVVKGSLFGRTLAELAHGVDVPDISALFGAASWMPPEPLRRLGFRVVAGVERLRARAEV